MKFKDYINISCQVILIFLILIFASFVPDLFPSFFGDWKCVGSSYVLDGQDHIASKMIGCDYSGIHNPTWHWGYRHYLFFFMGLILFIIQSVRLISFIDKCNKK